MIKSKSCERRVRVSRSRRDVESQLRPGRSARRGFPRFHPSPRERSTLSSVRPSSCQRLAITGSARERSLQIQLCGCHTMSMCVCVMSKWRIARWFFQRWVRQRPPLPPLQFPRTRSRYLSAGTAATRRWEQFNNNPVVEQFLHFLHGAFWAVPCPLTLLDCCQKLSPLPQSHRQDTTSCQLPSEIAFIRLH